MNKPESMMRLEKLKKEVSDLELKIKVKAIYKINDLSKIIAQLIKIYEEKETIVYDRYIWSENVSKKVIETIEQTPQIFTITRKNLPEQDKRVNYDYAQDCYIPLGKCQISNQSQKYISDFMDFAYIQRLEEDIDDLDEILSQYIKIHEEEINEYRNNKKVKALKIS